MPRGINVKINSDRYISPWVSIRNLDFQNLPILFEARLPQLRREMMMANVGYKALNEIKMGSRKEKKGKKGEKREMGRKPLRNERHRSISWKNRGDSRGLDRLRIQK